MKPYYEDERAVLYLADCRDVLPALAKGSADLIVTDPPYGVAWQSGYRAESFDVLHGDDGPFDMVEAVRAMLPVLRAVRHIYVFGLRDWGDLPIGGRTELVWDKGHFSGGDLTIPWGKAHEIIAFGVNNNERNRTDQGHLSARLRKGSIIRVNRVHNGDTLRHPTEKPVELLRILIESSSHMGETVLDPYAGSGSTLVAAVLEGRKAVGIEIDERYADVAAKRLEACRQIPLMMMEAAG